MVALRSQGNWRWEGPLGTPLGLVHWKRASSPVEAGTSGFLCSSARREEMRGLALEDVSGARTGSLSRFLESWLGGVRRCSRAMVGESGLETC